MIPSSPFFLVLTNTVLNCDASGYRGVYRSDPAGIAFARDDMSLWGQFSDEGVFFDIPPAVQELELARRHNIHCEIVECRIVLPGDEVKEVPGGGELLGYDVAQPFSDFYSAIVDRCMMLWTPSESQENPFVTLAVVAEYFNAMLNPNRLFDDVRHAQRFLRADRECASRFDGEMSCELSIVSVRSVC